MKKAIPWFGMVAALVYVAGVLLGGALVGRAYNHLVHAISEIDIMVPRDLRPITTSVFALYGIGLFLFGAGAFVYGRESNKPLVNIALAVLALNAASGLLMGFFPQDPRDATPTFQGTVHLILAGFSALFSVLSPLLVGIASVRTPGSRRLGWYSIVSSIIIFLSGGVTAAAAANSEFHYFGLVERVTIGTFIAWVFVYAAWLRSNEVVSQL
jgi:hypothetical protein